ncbi:hypothetical protein Peur_007186 [Populus x canadensis]
MPEDCLCWDWIDQLLLPDCNFQHCDLNVEKAFEVSTFSIMWLIRRVEGGGLGNTREPKLVVCEEARRQLVRMEDWKFGERYSALSRPSSQLTATSPNSRLVILRYKYLESGQRYYGPCALEISFELYCYLVTSGPYQCEVRGHGSENFIEYFMFSSFSFFKLYHKNKPCREPPVNF